MGSPGARLPDVVAIHVGRADEAAAERPIDDLPAVEHCEDIGAGKDGADVRGASVAGHVQCADADLLR